MDHTQVIKIFNSLEECLYLKDSEGNFTGCNKSFLDLIGIQDQDEIIGKSTLKHIDIHAATLIEENDNKVLKDNLSCSSIISLKINNEENRKFKLTKAPIVDGSKIQNGMFAVLTEVTEVTDKEKITTLENIISVLPGHVYWKNTECILQGCNDQQAIDVGLKSRNDIVGKSAYDLIWQDQQYN